MFDTVSIDELRKLIPTISKQDSKYPNRHITPIIQSEAGCGKTSLLNMLKEDLGEDKYDFMATRNGTVKKTSLKFFSASSILSLTTFL